MLSHVGHSRTVDTNGGIVPADSTPRDMRWGVPRISTVEREVDPSHEGDATVDHDRLLVVAVREPRAAVGVSLDLRMAGEGIEHLANIFLRGLEDRERSPLPRQHAHVDPLGELGENVADDRRLVVPRHVQLRREEPASEIDVGLRACELASDRR